MLRSASLTNYFNYKKESYQNHFTGFMSFQHYKNDPMYSDVIVRPENNMCETQDLECFPIPEGVPQNGRDEGYYPQTSVAYFRFLWKEFEPKQGEYNYDFIQNILDGAKQNNQTLILRLMAHSTCERDDVPDWMKPLFPCPARPHMQRVKDSPSDPLYVKLFTKAVRALGERFDSNPFLEAVDISLPGAWGEGCNFELYNPEDIEELYNTYTSVFKNTRLMGQIINPQLILKINQKAKVGWRGDGLGDPFHIYEYYPPNIAQMPDLWQTSPVAFESYWWLMEWQRKGWDIDEIISLTLKWHISQFNAKFLPIPYEWKDKIDYWLSKMGYHFLIDFFKFPETAEKGDQIELKLGVDNIGVAPIYKKIPLKIMLCGETEFSFDTEVDITKWLPGKNVERVFLNLPNNLPEGNYDVKIGIKDDDIGSIWFCTDAKEKDGFYTVANIKII